MLLAVGGVVVVLLAAYYFVLRKPSGRNPFETDSRRPVSALEHDLKVRNKRLKQGYRKDLVPDAIDAIVIGSGMGGLTAAVVLAKAGKRVLVLEQHDQAGGSTHTFIEKGYEFDVGIHYIGEMKDNGIMRYLFEQITDGQVEWAHLEEDYDEVIIGDPATSMKRFPILSGRKAFSDSLKKSFPDNHADIDRFMALLRKARKSLLGYVSFKFLPLWATSFLAKTGLVNLYTDYFKESQETVKEVLDRLTTNEDLRAVLAYSFGDYGTPPSEAPFTMQAALQNHFLNGGSYPVGGSSEFAYTMIPIIEAAGGKVMVRAAINEIVTEGDRAVGVKVGKHNDLIKCPLIISSAGLINTVNLLQQPEKHSLESWGIHNVKAGMAALTVFFALKGSNEENDLKRRNHWVFRNNDLDGEFKKFMKLSRDDAAFNEDIPVPLMFASFPSSKDPTWDQRFPGKSTAEIVTLAPFEWFEQWKDERVMKRGDDYDALKNALGEKLWRQLLEIHPHLEDKLDFMEVGTALTNQYYLATSKGEIYGLDHTTERFNPANAARLRPETPVNGLYLTGQVSLGVWQEIRDIFSCGFAGAMFSGLLTASSVLNRNLYLDLASARNKFSPKKPKSQ